ncbi:MAG: hypothetical protein JWO31_2429 [Phycisphaerales bacterium]|nr:hypothetical protein [Phycisphaerales bacterium]
MIRNDRGDHFLLVTQHDHAAAAAALAGQLGNGRFDGPDPRPQVLLGTELHDAGWPMHDDPGGEADGPTLSPAGLPLDVLEVKPPLATNIWRESARRAAERDPYAGLLASLHVFTLSALAVSPTLTTNERFERREELFLVNQFQQDEIERQESLRGRLGLRTDRPLHLGLAAPNVDRDEDRLRFNFAWLRLCDAVSLDACAGRRLFDKSPVVHPRVGSTGMELAMAHPEPDVVTLDPWPFAAGRVELAVPARRVRREPFESVEAFRAAYAAAEPVTHRMTVRPG